MIGVARVRIMYSNCGIAQAYPSGKWNDLLYIRQRRSSQVKDLFGSHWVFGRE